MKRRLFIGILILFWLVFWVLNVLTPLLSDDYRYAYSFATGERMTHLSQLIPSMAAHYQSFNGRVVVHFFTQLMLMMDKSVFNVLNAGMAVLLLLVLYRLCRGDERHDCWLLGALGALVFLFAPIPGQTMLWLDGACNYLWGTTLILWVLVPWRDSMLGEGRAPNGRLLPLWLLACALMGATSENSSPAAVSLMLLAMGRHIHHKQRPAPWMWLGVGAACAGWLFMALSPGTLQRLSNDGTIAGASLPGELLMNFQTATNMLMNEALVPCCLFLALFTLGCFMGVNRARLFTSACLFACGLVANFSMVAVAFYPTRALMGAMMLLLAACGMLIPDLLRAKAAPAVASAVVCAAFLAALTFMSILPSNYNRFQEFNARAASIAAERDAGNLNITTYHILGNTTYDAFYQNSDITDAVDYWPNVYFARYYGLESIVINEYR